MLVVRRRSFDELGRSRLGSSSTSSDEELVNQLEERWTPNSGPTDRLQPIKTSGEPLAFRTFALELHTCALSFAPLRSALGLIDPLPSVGNAAD